MKQTSVPRPLLEIDPDLGSNLDSAARSAAEKILVSVALAPTGPWRPNASGGANPGDLGFLVIDGLLMRRVLIAGTRCTELLGQGDILRPWSMESAEHSSVPVEADWRIVGDTAEFAVLDDNVARQIGRWPPITSELFDRMAQRARWLSFQLAVCHTKYVQTRLLMVMWHFADRWGRVTPDGVIIKLDISHQALGEIIGARRPTVTTALGRLREEGKLEGGSGGKWLLRGEAPESVSLRS